MERIAAFEKVSFGQFCKDWQKNMGGSETDIRSIYDAIVLPQRATAGSAGYDFHAPCDISLAPGASLLIPTGIRAKIVSGYLLMLFPRSSLGFRYRMQLNTTVGIIDADYYGAENEGHIMCKITNDTNENKTLTIQAGQGMVQGIFVPFGITFDDEAEGKRTGGFGSTTEKRQ